MKVLQVGEVIQAVSRACLKGRLTLIIELADLCGSKIAEAVGIKGALPALTLASVDPEVIQIEMHPGLAVVLILYAPEERIRNRGEHPEGFGHRFDDERASPPDSLFRQVPVNPFKRVRRVPEFVPGDGRRRAPKSIVILPRCTSVRTPVSNTLSNFIARNPCSRRSWLKSEPPIVQPTPF